MNPACTWRFNAEYGVRSIQPKFQPVRPGKLVHLKRWTRFFETFPVGPNRSIEFWTEISRKFWLNGSRPWGLDSKIRFPATATRVSKIQGWRVPWKRKLLSISLVMQLAMAVYCCLNIGKFFFMILLTCWKIKQRNILKKVSLLTSYYH